MKIRDMRKLTGLSQSRFAEKYSIPLPTLQHWERDYTSPPKYFINLLEKTILSECEAPVYYTGKNGEKYIYNDTSGSISDMHGNTIQISEIIRLVKVENLPLYLSDLFESVNHARELFLFDCEEDTRSDIIWTDE
ncbi:MAG: helix-turn-helix domain-containing protein [Lachnospiraceae bacterium]|nr:helix-turn-helix domain-containing protein [Lachnospiraceae bacterium]